MTLTDEVRLTVKSSDPVVVLPDPVRLKGNRETRFVTDFWSSIDPGFESERFVEVFMVLNSFRAMTATGTEFTSESNKEVQQE